MKTLAVIVLGAALGMSGATGALSMSVVKPVADPGIYAGTAAGRQVAFFVSSSGRSLRDVSIALTDLACAPSGSGAGDALVIANAAIKPGGAFSARGSQTGSYQGFAAQYTYSFAGRFSRATKTHTGTAAGTFRESIRFTDQTGAHQTCTTNTKSWTATRSGPKLKALVASGNYTGTAGGRALTFAVALRRVNTVTIPLTDLSCVPNRSGADDTTFAIAQVPIRADGSFNARGSTTGVFGGAPATFTYSFSGSFEGLNSSGAGSAAGLFREDIGFTDNAGVHQVCTTNTRAWAAARTS
jgi:hypothetical protein